MGYQSNAAFRTQPCYSWGRPTKSPRIMLAATQDMSKAKIPIYMAIESDANGAFSPGPVYRPPAVASDRAASFGIGERHMYTQRRATAVPAKIDSVAPRPLPSAFHGQPDSRKSNSPAPSFAGRGRAYSMLRIAAPGDATAPHWGSRRAHVDSRRPTSASYGFSKGERFVDHSGSLGAAAYSLPPPPGKYAYVCRVAVSNIPRPATLAHTPHPLPESIAAD